MVEKSIPISKEAINSQLFAKEAIKEQRTKYKFLHIGLVQIEVKTST